MQSKCAYLLVGEEDYLLEQRLTQVVQGLGAPGEVERVTLEDDAAGRQQLLEFLAATPLFAHLRVLVVRHPRWFGAPGSKGAQNLPAVQEALARWLQNPNPYLTLVFTAESVARTNPLVKLLARAGAVEELKRPAGRELVAWLEAEFARRGARAERDLVREMAASGQEMSALANQAEKIALAFGDRPVSAGMARELLEGREEARVFALSDALLQRQAPAALRALHQLLVQGEPPLRMLAVISRQFVSLGKVKACLEQGMAPAGMAERLAMKEFLVTRMARAAARFSWEELEEACLGLLSADMALKSSPLDERLVLEMLVARICLPA